MGPVSILVKLVHTVERYAPLIGGAERVVQRVSEGLASRGHEVVVVTSGSRRSETLNRVRIERFPLSGNAARGISGDTRAVLRIVDEFAPDIVFNYAAQTWHADTFASRIGEPRSYRLVLAPCGFSAMEDPRYAGYFSQMRSWLPHYDALVLHSAVYRDWEFAAAAGTPPNLMHVIPNGADEPPLRRAHSRAETLFATVGSHVRSKGHSEFVAAVRQIGSTTAARGVVVAPPRRGLDIARGCQPRCLLESLRPDRVIRFIDGRPLGAVGGVLAEADAFLFPSQIECAPIVILEAMAAGVPWVSYDVGNVRELAGGVVVGSLDELVDAGAQLARRPGERARLGEGGRRAWRQRYRWPQIVDRYEQLFTQLSRAAPVTGAV